ncbi:helix-turn-helix transcriptional regulator [Sphingomonas sp. IC-11]|uniref:helix-turn-helix transcriptional regulator n=1 Tax=Sphingomonas sp. IC-11 TaxID=2898528 RepID=UPI001E3C14A4|nr:helix-turn-helix transcriptional regulator [Sphingomonas sp. IC-11]
MAGTKDITNQFLEAAVDPARWMDVLERLAHETGSDHAQIIGVGPSFSLEFNWVNDMDASAHAVADRAELMTPATNYRVAAGLTQSSRTISWEDRYEAIKPHLTDDAYLDMCNDLRIPFGCQTNLLVEADGLIGFALLRSDRNGPTDAETRALFASACAPAAAAVSLQAGLEREGYQLVAGAFEVMSVACFVLDRSMSVRAMSRAAEQLLSDGTLQLVDGRVTASSPGAQRRIGSATTAVMEGRAAAASVAAPDAAGMLMLKVHRLPSREWNMGFAPFAILIAKRPPGGSDADVAVLRDAYGLTVAEAEIAMLLRAGRTREAICAVRAITRETLRSHLRSLFSKLGVKKETEAIHLLHALLS